MHIEVHIRESIVPGWTISNQRIPAAGPPTFSNTFTFDDNVGDVFFCKMLAHRDAGLTTADYNNFNVLLCHDYASEIFVRSITAICQKCYSICIDNKINLIDQKKSGDVYELKRPCSQRTYTDSAEVFPYRSCSSIHDRCCSRAVHCPVRGIHCHRTARAHAWRGALYPTTQQRIGFNH